MKKLLCIIFTMVLYCSCFSSTYAFNYKSIDENEIVNEDTMKSSLINKILTEKSDLEEYLESSHSQENKDRLFLTYYSNLGKMIEKYPPIYNTRIPDNYNYSANGNVTKFEDEDDADVEYQYTTKNHYIEPGSMIIIRPTNFNDVFFNYGYGYVPEINHSALKENYGKNLSECVNDFLTIQAQFDIDKNGYELREYLWEALGFIYEGEKDPVDKNKIGKVKNIIAQIKNFKTKYPDFPLMGTLNHYLKKYQLCYDCSTSENNKLEEQLFDDEFKSLGFSKKFEDNNLEQVPELSYDVIIYPILGLFLLILLYAKRIYLIKYIQNTINIKNYFNICPICEEKIEKFIGICPICGEKISIFLKIKQLLKIGEKK